MAKDTESTTITLKKNKNEDRDLELALKELGAGYKYRLFRKEPSWCDGQIGTFDIDPAEPLSVDDIRRRFGGRKVVLSIVNPDGSYKLSRTLSFPDPPREDGCEITPGPNGAPIRVDKLAAAIDQFQKQPEKPTETPAPASASNDTLLAKMLDIQAASFTATQNMQASRIEHLERLLEQRSSAPTLGADLARHDGTERPFDGLRDTLKVIKEMEEIRAVLGPAAAPSETISSAWAPLVDKMADFILTKQKADMEFRARQLAAAGSAPPLPPPAFNQSLPAPENMSDGAFIDLLQKKLSQYDPETKAKIIQAVFGDEVEEIISFIPEPENDPEKDNEACVNDPSEVRSELISAEDRALVDRDDTTTGNKSNS